MKEQRIKLIGKLLHQQGNTARAFVQYMDSDREYTAGDKLYMREAHFVIAIGPGEGRTMSEIAREMNVTQGAVSQIASRLEKKGYVCRRKNEENILLRGNVPAHSLPDHILPAFRPLLL